MRPRRWLSCTRRSYKSARTELCEQLEAKIKLSGPLTVSQYMKEALTNPVAVRNPLCPYGVVCHVYILFVGVQCMKLTCGILGLLHPARSFWEERRLHHITGDQSNVRRGKITCVLWNYSS